MTSAPLILGIGGSTGPTSKTELLLTACLAHAARLGARTRAIPAVELAVLPIYGSDGPGVAPAVEEFVAAVRAADAVIVATPGYHGGMSGLIKNALDHLEMLRDDPRPYLDGRAVGVIVSAAGWQAAGTTLGAVRSTIHALRGWPTPFGATVNSVEQRPDDERVDEALAILAGQVVEFTGWRAAAQARGASS